MSWVNSEEASQWIQKHALKTPLSRVVQLGGYDYGKSEREGERAREKEADPNCSSCPQLAKDWRMMPTPTPSAPSTTQLSAHLTRRPLLKILIH